MTIAEALQAAKSDPGRIYRCVDQGETVEIRVVPTSDGHGSDAETPRRLLTKELCEEDIMLDAWCELPEPKWTKKARIVGHQRFWPDIPEIPHDEDVAE